MAEGKWHTKHKICDYVRGQEAQSKTWRQEFPGNNSHGFKSKNGNLYRFLEQKGPLPCDSFSVPLAYRCDNPDLVQCEVIQFTMSSFFKKEHKYIQLLKLKYLLSEHILRLSHSLVEAYKAEGL